jgi:drug/metabolite transporter (DMT)-like permease
MRVRWNQFGGQLGVGLCVAGLLLIFLGWNGAASWDRVPSQFPYLISGGIAGLSLVIIGAALFVVQSQRADRARLESKLGELRDAIQNLATSDGSSTAGAIGAGIVVAGPTTFHRPDCRVIDGRGPLPTMSYNDALARGLHPCRTCAPAAEADSPRRKRSR